MFRISASTNSSSIKMIICDNKNVKNIHNQVRNSLKLLEQYEWLINSFVLDFYDSDHWSSLPRCWQQFLDNISPTELADWLDTDKELTNQRSEPWPLSLLALRQSLKHLSVDRKPVTDLTCVAQYLGEDLNDNEKLRWQFDPELMSKSSKHHQSLKHVFRKHVKPKKQYEMCRLAKLSSSTAQSLGVDTVLDIGSGVGHLSRYLCYNHRLTVACVDADDNLTVSARKFDEELETAVEKMKRRQENAHHHDLSPVSPVHVTARIAPDMDLDSFHSLLSDKLNIVNNNAELRYGVVGLHTCGDLAPVILRMFTQDPASVMINSLGCCYMKIQHHFPMSQHVSSHTWHDLTYTSTELACHAVEVYTDKLRSGEEEKLRVHSNRAVLETLLRQRSDQWSHTILKTVARSHLLSFSEYVTRATFNLVRDEGLEPFTNDELESEEVKKMLSQWWRVAVFYTLRLAFAPLIGK